MSKTAKKENDLVTIYKASQIIKVKARVLTYHIENGKIESTDGKIHKSVCNKILEQQSNYIGIRFFLKKHDSDRFDSKYAKNRDKYIDFLEENNYFNIEIVETENILFNLPDKEDFYVTKEDAQFLEFKSEEFFRDFGLTEKEKIESMIKLSAWHPLNKKYVKKYITYIENENNIYTPALTEFVKIIFNISEITRITDEEIISVIEDADIARTKILLVDFFRYVADYEIVNYHNIELKKKERNPAPAYSYEDFVKLARILFNSDYDKEHNLTIKALENSKYIETWMFLACHYICGWRASDICNRWVYPDIKSNDNPFKINIKTLKEDILNENITDDTYDKIALYSIRRIEMANNAHQKTGMGKLRSEIVPELRKYFGKLILVAEYHHITSGEGYMHSYRTDMYRNWVICKEFFGEEIFAITGSQPISSRRLNKSYLQGLEQAARDNGNTTLMAHVVAAYARNHANINTTAIYLRDHGLTGESAEIVLYMMMQRGVFGVSLYHALIAAYPQAFKQLPAKEQTEIMAKIPLSAFELETAGAAFIAANRIAGEFAEGKVEEPKEILKAMYNIVQDRGKGKDAGIYCKKQALGFCCGYPTYESCLANLCPYYVFTNDGIPSLIKVIKDYQCKAIATGNNKYEIALKSKIIPAFQTIINEIIKEMSKEEKEGMKKLLKEVLDG